MNTLLRNTLVICTLVVGTVSTVNAAKKQGSHGRRVAAAMVKKGAQLKRKHALYTGRTYRGCQREANRPKRPSAQTECTSKSCFRKR